MHLLCLPVLTYLLITWLGMIAQASEFKWRPDYYSATKLLFFCMMGYHAVRLVFFFAAGGLHTLATENLIARLLN